MAFKKIEQTIQCRKCGTVLAKLLDESILRREDENPNNPAFNFLITKFSLGDLGKQFDNFNICDNCMGEFYEWLNEKEEEKIKCKCGKFSRYLTYKGIEMCEECYYNLRTKENKEMGI